MKKVLLVSFDLIREGESSTTLSIGSLLANAYKSQYYNSKFTIEHLSLNMSDENLFNNEFQLLKKHSFCKYDIIAFSAYIWSEKWLRELLVFLRHDYRYKGKILLGGYQVSYSNDENLIKDYAEADIFLKGFAEKSFVQVIENEINNIENLKIHSSSLDFDTLPSPYLENTIEVKMNQGMVRMEAKRGCPYKCSFCSHKDNLNNKVYYRDIEKTVQEIDFMHSKKVKKINFLDPVFNINGKYIEIVKHLNQIKYKGTISIQSRPELITGEKGKLFLDTLEGLNVNLEFGIQTLDEQVNSNIIRQNKYPEIYSVFSNVLERKINFEVSLIYGLPGQTLKSFENDINTLTKLGVKDITAWPLMLLKGTKLHTQKEEFSIKEAVLGKFQIPHVVKSNTFSEHEWQQMYDIAVKLNPNSRVY